MNIKELIERLQKPEQTIDIDLVNGTTVKSFGFEFGCQRKEAAEALLAQQVCIEQMRDALTSLIEQGTHREVEIGIGWIPEPTEALKFARETLPLQPSLEALREHDAEVVEKLANVTFKHDCDCSCPCDCYSPTAAKFQLLDAAERIRKGE